MYNTIVCILVDSLCKAGLVDDALQLFNEMIGKGVSTNESAYNSLIHGLCNYGRENRGCKNVERYGRGRCLSGSFYF